ncbi:MAG: hypothetical protein K9J37_23315 [Saprospiraceae bacterium]|nr:hypothetical protein [Saprospiraceae bacterium]MCF8252856.1 hypothetical protein [Saprospiraceae bacterium]MCF8283311.1 hypothetical protein [Bacteroidales bacterium]MCF8314408.1 hypothetical protein [Saprospiraceae bacterium]MCF8443298.1 hypothetical protein [Saprospiraceae bacterium]
MPERVITKREIPEMDVQAFAPDNMMGGDDGQVLMKQSGDTSKASIGKVIG